MGRSHPNLLPLLSNKDTTSSSLESTRGSQALRYTRICDCFYKIWGPRAREWSNFTKDGGTTAWMRQGSRSDVFTTLWARPGAWFSIFLQLLFFPSLLVFFFSGGYLEFLSPHYGGWKGGLSSPFPSYAIFKITLGHNPKGWCVLTQVWAA
jgi:hypothetical protein